MVKTMDSSLAYLVSQLDALDPKLYEPLYNVTWGRDIKLRSGVGFGHESTSFVRVNYGTNGTLNAGGMPFIAENATTLNNVTVNGERVVLPMRLLGLELAYSSVELDRSQLLGTSIDTQKFNALNAAYQMATDRMVYVGTDEFGTAVGGLVNNANVASTPAAKDWASATADEILAEINNAIETSWKSTGYAVCPNKILLPPENFALLAGRKVSDSGEKSVLTFIEDNSLSLRINGSKVEIVPVKWLSGLATNGKGRMVVYTNDEDKVRFPMVPIRRETTYTKGINFIAPYIWAFGEVEFVQPETALYVDGV